MKRVFLACLPLLLCLSAPSAHARVWYVKPLGSGDGQNWSAASPGIPAVMAMAVAGDQVWVAAGTYNRHVDLKEGVALYGGFAGTETDLAQRSPRTNETILDGSGLNASVITIATGGNDTIVDGFTIQNGTGTYLSESWIHEIRGGAILIRDAAPTIRGNVFRANQVTGSGGAIAMVNSRGSSPWRIEGNVFDGNSAQYKGGALFAYWTGTGTAVLARNIFRGNNARHCGAVFLDTLGPAQVVGNLFVRNEATSGSMAAASISSTNSSFLQITNNTVVDNGNGTGPVSNQRGAIEVSGLCPGTFANNIVAFNAAGLGSLNDIAPMVVRDNDIYGNTATTYYYAIDPTGKDGNIAEDPMLADRAAGDYRLRSGSPCIDSGDDDSVAYGQTDLDGSPRVMGAHVDMGAYEATGMVPRPFRLRVTEQPGSGIAGQPLTRQPKVTAYLLSGDVMTDFDGSVTMSLVEGTGTAGATLTGQTTVSAVNGVAAFSTIGVSQPGTGYRLAATAGAAYSDASAPFDVTGAPVALAFTTQPGRAVAGKPFGTQPVVELRDAQGSLVGLGNAPVTVSLRSGTGPAGAVLSGTTTVPAVNGIATFTDLSLDKTGQGYVLTASLDPQVTGDSQAFSVSSAIVYVRPDGDDSRSGQSWSEAMQAVNSALSKAASLGATEVWVAAGTYGTVSLVPGVSLYGGFAGTESAREQRDAASHETILRGTTDNTVVYAPPTITIATVLDGFTITHGGGRVIQQPSIPGDHVTSGNYYGGGVFLEGSPVLSNNVITGNNTVHTSSYFDGWSGWNYQPGPGGGIYVKSGSPRIQGNVISGNTGRAGGGIAVSGGSPVIIGNTIRDNEAPTGADSRGGGIALSPVNGITITDNVISGNRSDTGGGICTYDAGPSLIARNRITGNTAQQGGGYCGLGDGLSNRGDNLLDNVIAGNTATQSGSGAVAYCGKIINNTIVRNTGPDGALCIWPVAPMAAANNIVAFNTTGCSFGTLSQVTFQNNDVFGNGGQDYLGAPDQTGNNGTLSADPLFVDLASGDYHLKTGSPCLDAGTDTYLATGETDVDGQPRLLGAHVDMGAFESRVVDQSALQECIRALRIAAGLDALQSGQAAELDADTSGSTVTVDLRDAAAWARKAAGL